MTDDPDVAGQPSSSAQGDAPQGDVPLGDVPPVSTPWVRLRGLTAARIGLARAGASLATQPLLDFRLAHALARDAVHDGLDAAKLADDAATLGLPVLITDSAAGDRRTYLMRPDLGRRLGAESVATLAARASTDDLAIVVADGLSARAVQTHAVPVLALALPALQAEGWRIAPLVIVRQGRVAVGDTIAVTLGAGAVAVLVGERPGLSAPDSMGAYLTWRPRLGSTDAERNCISNIRPAGVNYADAAFKLTFLLRELRRHSRSGVSLKDNSDHAAAIGSVSG